jgi:hypothetical protein
VSKHWLVRALVLLGAATATSLITVNFVQSAEECRPSPGSTAPAGSRWLYRINRTDHRHCWFLNSNLTGAHSHVSGRSRRFKVDADKVREHQQTENDISGDATSKEKGHVVVAQLPTAPAAVPPSNRQASEALIARRVPVTVFRAQPADSRTETAVERVESTAPNAAVEPNIGFLAGAVVAGLFFAGGVFHHARRRVRGHSPPDQAVVAGSPAGPTALAGDRVKIARGQNRRRESIREKLPLLNETHRDNAFTISCSAKIRPAQSPARERHLTISFLN